MSNCACYFGGIGTGAELGVECVFEEEAEEGVAVGREDWVGGVCEFGHEPKRGWEEELGLSVWVSKRGGWWAYLGGG